MAITRYTSRNLPDMNIKQAATEEFRNIQLTTDSIIAILQTVGVPIVIGPADSGGSGFRVLRIPN